MWTTGGKHPLPGAGALSRRGQVRLLDGILRWPPETFVRWQLEALAARGVFVTAASTASRREATTRLDGVHLLRVPGHAESRFQMLFGAIWDALPLLLRPARLRALLRAVRYPWPPSGAKPSRATTIELLRKYLRLARVRPDIVHFEWESAACHYLPLMEVWDCPVVMSCLGASLDVFPHTPTNERWLSRLPIAFGKAAAIHCVSEATREQAVRFGVDPAKTCVIRPAVDTRFFAPPAARIDSDGLRVISVGRLDWAKGHEYALAAIAELARRGVPARLQLIGDGDDHDRVAATISDLGLSAQVKLLGRLEPGGVRDRLHESEALLHASLAEGIPNVVLEAMACGLPVVATDVVGTGEAVTDGREGFLVAPRDPEAMAAALERLWIDRDLRRRMGQAGRQRVESAFTLAEQVQRRLALYEHITNGSGHLRERDALAVGAR